MKWRSQARLTMAMNGVRLLPGPPCATTITGLARSSPRMLTHCSMPPICTKPLSSMPFGVRIASAAATRDWRQAR